MKRIVLFTILFSFTANSIKCQTENDPLLYTAKLLLASEKFALDSIGWFSFFSKYQSNYIKSKGFDKIKFISIESTEDSAMKNEESYIENKHYFSCHYIVAYNPMTFLFYKLKGFRTIDLFDFIYDLKRYSTYQEGTEFFQANDEKAVEMLKHSACFVEQLDIDCLRRYSQSDKTAITQPIFTCVLSCVKRDSNL